MHGPMNVKHFYILHFENYFCVNGQKQDGSAKLFSTDKRQAVMLQNFFNLALSFSFGLTNIHSQ
jgi:hypothetical protein